MRRRAAIAATSAPSPATSTTISESVIFPCRVATLVSPCSSRLTVTIHRVSMNLLQLYLLNIDCLVQKTSCEVFRNSQAGVWISCSAAVYIVPQWGEPQWCQDFVWLLLFPWCTLLWLSKFGPSSLTDQLPTLADNTYYLRMATVLEVISMDGRPLNSKV